MKKLTIEKISRKIWSKIVKGTRHTRMYPYIYRSYWHYLMHKSVGGKDLSGLCYTARPNPGAGIGHQMANWIAGLWYSKQFGLQYAYLPFSKKQWDDFLGFSEGFVKVKSLVEEGYAVRRLPLFEDGNEREMELNRRIISSYAGRRVVFLAEQDQFYRDQYGVMEEIQKLFHNAPSRKEDKLLYDQSNFNIAIHVRRGDIMVDLTNPGLAKRYLSNDYFEKVLRQVVDNIHVNKPVHIWFFSQGVPEDYPEFTPFPNLHWCMDMGARESFLHMVYADLLITSKSSFSYKPALLSRGLKVCPRNFWHSYPESSEWVLCEDDGSIHAGELEKVKSEN